MNPSKNRLVLARAKKTDYVFINCPFDKAYLPILHAIVFTVYRCGYTPVTAFNENNAMEQRLDKLARFIGDCPYGIHDISRTTLDKNLPRFNMPFELGMFYGLKYYRKSPQQKINGLVLETKSYNYQRYISDLNGIDVRAHNDDPEVAIEKVRDWFYADLKSNSVPYANLIKSEYKLLLKFLPSLAKSKGFDLKKIGFNDYCNIVEKHLEFLSKI